MTTLAFLGSLGGWEIALIAFVFLVLFGAKKIPQLMKGLGEGIREFKNTTKKITEDIDDVVNKE